MIFNGSNPHDAGQCRAYLENLISKGVMIEVKRKAPLRSLSQNNYLHLALGWFASQYGCSLEEAKIDYYKRTCNTAIFEREAYNKSGKRVKYLRSTAELDTKEMNQSIENFRNWSSAVAEIYIPAPNEEQFLAFCMREIEKDRAYIRD